MLDFPAVEFHLVVFMLRVCSTLVFALESRIDNLGETGGWM